MDEMYAVMIVQHWRNCSSHSIITAATANDLTNKARSLVNEPLAHHWSYDKYENRFEADDEHQRSIVSNSVLIYVNASESLGDVSANLCIIYFMAVSYSRVSEPLFIILHSRSITTWKPREPLIGKMSRKRHTSQQKT